MTIIPGCEDGGSVDSDRVITATAVSPLFEECAKEVGLEWRHHPGSPEGFPMTQIMGGGCALFDANGDDRLDALLVPGTLPDGTTAERMPVQLYLQDESGQFQLHAESGLWLHAYGMGATIGDIDNDADVDVLLTSASGPRLFLNDGHAVFSDVTQSAGIASTRWCTAAAMADIDRDGWLDLMIVNYVDYFPGSVCQDGTGRRDYCGPLSFTGTTDRLYRNLGAAGSPSVFEDMTVNAGLTAKPGKGLGVICSDLTGDQLTDIYVANDMEPNHLWVQRADGTFHDEAAVRGCATDVNGRPQASMGTLWHDLNDDQQFDIFLTHLRGETNTFYQQLSHGVFRDESGRSSLAAGSLNFTGFGVAATDIDCDGNTDLLIVNGRVMRSPLSDVRTSGDHWAEYAERNQILLGNSRGTFTDEFHADQPFTADSRISRGLAMGDIDNDGDLDTLVVHVNEQAQLFRNVAEKQGHWIAVRLMDPNRSRDAIGARVEVEAEEHVWSAELQPNAGYQSAHDFRLFFGLGEHRSVTEFRVTWPDGEVETERFAGCSSDQHVTLSRGTGLSSEAPQREVVR